MALCSYMAAREAGDISPQVLLTVACATCAISGMCTKCAACCHRGHLLRTSASPIKGVCHCALGGDCCAGGAAASEQGMAKHAVAGDAVGAMALYLLTMCEHDGIVDLLAASLDKTSRVPLLAVLRGVRFLEPSGEFTSMDLHQATRMVGEVDAIRTSKRGGQNVAVLPRHVHLPTVAGLLQLHSAGTSFKSWRQGHSAAAWQDTEQLLGAMPRLVLETMSVPWFFVHLCLCSVFSVRCMLPPGTEFPGIPQRSSEGMDPLHQYAARQAAQQDGVVQSTALLGLRGSGALHAACALALPPMPRHSMQWRATGTAPTAAAALLALRDERIHRETQHSAHASGVALLHAPPLVGVLRWGGQKRQREAPQDTRHDPWTEDTAQEGLLDFQEQLQASMAQAMGVAAYRPGTAELYSAEQAAAVADKARQMQRTTQRRRALQGDATQGPMGEQGLQAAAAAEGGAAAAGGGTQPGEGDEAGSAAAPTAAPAAAEEEGDDQGTLSASGVMAVRSQGQGLLVEDLLMGGVTAIEGGAQDGDSSAAASTAGDGEAAAALDESALPQEPLLRDALAWEPSAPALAQAVCGVPGSGCPMQVQVLRTQAALQRFVQHVLTVLYAAPPATGLALRSVFLHATYQSQPVFTERFAGVLETEKMADTLQYLVLGSPRTGWACLCLQSLWEDFYTEHGGGTDIARFSATLARYLPSAREALLDAFKGGLGTDSNDTRLDVQRSPLQSLARLLLDPGVLKVTSALSLLAPVLDGDFGLYIAHALDVGAAAALVRQHKPVLRAAGRVLDAVDAVVVLAQPAGVQTHVQLTEQTEKAGAASNADDTPPVSLAAAAGCLPLAAAAVLSLLAHAPHLPAHAEELAPLYDGLHACLQGGGDIGNAGGVGVPVGSWDGAPHQLYVAGCCPQHCGARHQAPLLAQAYVAAQLLCLEAAPSVRRGTDLSAIGSGGYRADSSVVALPAWFQRCSFCRGHGHSHVDCPKAQF